MTFTAFLKAQLTDFVDVYEKYFKQTFGIACMFSAVCFAAAALLFAFSNFERAGLYRVMDLLSYFFQRYSKPNAYILSDLTKTVFIYLVSLFSLLLIKQPGKDAHSRVLSLKHFRYVTLKEFSMLTLCLVVACVADYILFRASAFLINSSELNRLTQYYYSFFFHLRIYAPLFLFALVLRFLTAEQQVKITLQQLLFLYVSLWLFNEFAGETLLLVRQHVLQLVFLPFNDIILYYAFDCLAGIPLIAFYFLGYYSAIFTPLRLAEQTLLAAAMQAADEL